MSGDGEQLRRGHMNQGSRRYSSHLKGAGGEFPACVAGVDIQRMHLVSHGVLSYNNDDITSEHDSQLLWQLTWSPSSPSVP